MKKIMILLSLLMFLPLTAISKPLIPIMKTLFTDVTGTVPDAEEIAHKAELFANKPELYRLLWFYPTLIMKPVSGKWQSDAGACGIFNE